MIFKPLTYFFMAIIPFIRKISPMFDIACQRGRVIGNCDFLFVTKNKNFFCLIFRLFAI